MQLLRELTDAAIEVVEINGARLAQAIEADPRRVREWTAASAAADVVLDFVGSASSLDLAARAVRSGGTVVVVGSEHGPQGMVVALRPEVTVVHSIWGSLPELIELVALARAGRLTLAAEAMPLAAVNQALSLAEIASSASRIVLVP